MRENKTEACGLDYMWSENAFLNPGEQDKPSKKSSHYPGKKGPVLRRGKAVKKVGSEHQLPEKGCHLRLWDGPCLQVRSFIQVQWKGFQKEITGSFPF